MGGSKQQQTPKLVNNHTGKARGTVQHVYPARGFGFIRCTEGGGADDVGADFFFHTTGLAEGLTLEELLPGELVEFECREVPRGKRAEHVTRV